MISSQHCWRKQSLRKNNSTLLYTYSIKHIYIRQFAFSLERSLAYSWALLLRNDVSFARFSALASCWFVCLSSSLHVLQNTIVCWLVGYHSSNTPVHLRDQLLGQLYTLPYCALPQPDRRCRSNFLSHLLKACWYRADALLSRHCSTSV